MRPKIPMSWSQERLILFILPLMLMVSGLQASATTYAVKAAGGGNYTTIQDCANVAVAGDTCVVYAGSYSGWTQSKSGSAGNPITFTVNPGDSVTITSDVTVSGTNYVVIGAPVTIGSPSAGTGCAANSTQINGVFGTFNVGGCFTFSSAGIYGISSSSSVTTHLTVAWNTATGQPDRPFVEICNSGGCGTNSDSSSYNIGAHNKVAWTATAPFCFNAFYMYGDDLLLEYNDVSGVGDDFADLGGADMVVRHNRYHDNDMSVSVGCGQSPEHNDFVQGIGGQSPVINFTLIERNEESNCTNDGGNCHFVIIRTLSSGTADTNIVRYNFWQGLDGGATVQFGGVGDTVPNNGMYNNDNASGGQDGESGSCGQWQNAANGFAFNNICYNSSSTAATCSGSPCPGGPFYDGGNGLRDNGNLVFNTGYSGSWPGVYSNESTYSALANKDPLFISFPSNISLSSVSPAIGAGVGLTTASGSGSSSSSLTVGNAHLFQPGWAGIPGDWIRIGSSSIAQISSINYSTNVITLATPVSWNAGDSVYLYKDSTGNVVLSGANPDLGSYASDTSVSGAPAPPTGLKVVAVQ